jgi:hypothetical protein
LSINAFFHSIIDALQTKWGNGVHLFAPFNWDLINFGLFWPESIITYALTVFGLIVFGFFLFKKKYSPSGLVVRPIHLMVLSAVYLISPLFFFSGPIHANSHFADTL